MVLSESIWIYLNLSESIWIYLNLSESIWIYLNLSESIWIYFFPLLQLLDWLPNDESVRLVPQCWTSLRQFQRRPRMGCEEISLEALWVAKHNATPHGKVTFHFSGGMTASIQAPKICAEGTLMIQNGPGYRHAKRACLVHLEAMLKKIEENMNEAGWELPPVTLCQLGQPSVKLCQVSMRKPFKRCDLEYLVHPQCCDHHRATAAAWNWNLSKSPVPVFHEVLDLESLRQCSFAINRSLQPGRRSSKPVLLYIYIYLSLSIYSIYIYIESYC